MKTTFTTPPIRILFNGYMRSPDYKTNLSATILENRESKEQRMTLIRQKLKLLSKVAFAS